MAKKSIPFKLDNDRYFVKDSGFMAALHYLNEDYPLHWHEFYEIEYIVTGHATENINGTDHDAAPGYAVLITPDDLHSYHHIQKDDVVTVYNVKFSPYLLPPELQKMLSGLSAPLYGNCPEIKPLFERLLIEYNGHSFARNQYIISTITQICIHLFRFRQKQDGTANDQAHKMVMYIREHYSESISAQTVAEEFHLTPNYFSEVFKKYVGIGFSAYVKNLRLKFAAKLLLTSDLTVREIAEKSGFNSTAHFFNSFKAEYKIPPEQFRKKYKQQSEKED